MTKVIDERGNVLEKINVIDLLVVLLATAVLTAGLALVIDSSWIQFAPVGLGVFGIIGLAKVEPDTSENDSSEEQSQYLQVRIKDVDPAVADAITVGDTTIGGGLTVSEIGVSPTTVTTKKNDGTLYVQPHPHSQTVRLVAKVHPEIDTNGEFRGDRLYVGRELRLDFDQVRVDATVVGFEEDLPIERTANTGAVSTGTAVSPTVAD